MDGWVECLRTWLQIVSYCVAIVGVIWGLRKYGEEKRKDRQTREKEAFAVSNQRYVEYLRLCLQYPELDAFEIPRDQPELRAAGIKHEKLILFSALTAVLETAFHFYGDVPSDRLREQWRAWDRYLELWAGREDYRRAWPLMKPQFHDHFVRYMDDLIGKAATNVGEV